jgi:hypothetical protein
MRDEAQPDQGGGLAGRFAARFVTRWKIPGEAIK